MSKIWDTFLYKWRNKTKGEPAPQVYTKIVVKMEIPVGWEHLLATCTWIEKLLVKQVYQLQWLYQS